MAVQPCTILKKISRDPAGIKPPKLPFWNQGRVPIAKIQFGWFDTEKIFWPKRGSELRVDSLYINTLIRSVLPRSRLVLRLQPQSSTAVCQTATGAGLPLGSGPLAYSRSFAPCPPPAGLALPQCEATSESTKRRRPRALAQPGDAAEARASARGGAGPPRSLRSGARMRR
eukprot:SAG31_NODE_73_length_27793_cov_26.900520_14_plen_171_part_00